MKVVKKKWGSEVWIANVEYCGKILNIKRQHRCSIHLHEKKTETFYILEGQVLLEVDGRKYYMNSSYPCAFTILKGVPHRFTGLTDAKLIEVSTHHDDKDSYRSTESGKVPDEEWREYADQNG